jgi:hypothetical protein
MKSFNYNRARAGHASAVVTERHQRVQTANRRLD